MTVSGQDLDAWKTWQRQPTEMNLQEVLRRLDPLIQKEVNRWSGTMARPLLELEAKRLAAEGIRSYSPTAGAALGTHVVNQLKKLSRMSYTHQNVARIPEYQVLKFHSFNMAQSALADKLGRDPTNDELQDELGWSRSGLNSFQRSIRKEYTESGNAPPMLDTQSDEGGLVDFMYNDLSPTQKKLFQHTTGYNDAPVLGNPQLMKKLKLTQGQLSYQKRLLVNHIQKTIGDG